MSNIQKIEWSHYENIQPEFSLNSFSIQNVHYSLELLFCLQLQFLKKKMENEQDTTFHE